MFSAGPRICLGKTLAIMESKLVSTILLEKYKFTLAKDADVRYVVTITLNMMNGLKCNVTPRR